MLKYFIFIFMFSEIASSQSVLGFWKTVDSDGISKSVIKIYKTDSNKLEGKVHKILKESKRDIKCTACTGDKKGKPIEGLVILEDMKRDEDEYKGGEITDPENGKTYDCKIWIDENDPDILHVRGYVAFFYRTQNWIRVEKGEF